MDAFELSAVVAWAFVVSLVGGVVGLVLGNLRLPLILVFASSPAAGAGANVAISGAAALASAGRHLTAGRIDWRLFRWMAPTSLAGAIGGGLISGEVPDQPLLIAIGLLILYGAWEVFRHDAGGVEPPPPGARAHLVNAAVVGIAVGLLGGFVGLILGSLRLPALVKYAGITPYAAIGTNAGVGVVVGLGGLIGHLPSGIDWDLFAAGCAGGVPGAYLGAQLTGRLAEHVLLTACAVVLVVSGTAVLVQALV
ncbi:MAG: sulfite exporter TauE/SafE family protein [Geminicoccales bacterium]